MPYKITDYSYNQAKKLNVEIKPSTNKKKKIDVYKNDKKIATIGAIGFLDYPNYLKEDKNKAEVRRKLYKQRHEKDRHKKGTAGYFASNILW
jgi:hypothetical protein